ncbi:hypothetical protein N431DRAFT_519081 [Stipitochalara longipes BDJ]|nr:hypothetical protein N431DRAFT_519081 [Stipitochalara longipes BDJ]
MADSTCITEEPISKRLRSTNQTRSSLRTMSAQPTIYETLDKTKREIRLCDLVLSSDLSARLECSLRIVPVDKMGKFVAFSYVWGQELATETISINGIQHPIRYNLAAGLRELRARSWRDRAGRRKRQRPCLISVWADAICINQNDIGERNHQVPHMRLIFSKCDYTFSWLGEADDTSDLAMDSIAEMTTFATQQHAIPLLETLTQQGNLFCKAGPWIAIYRLLNREFWHRVWIYQELILPKKLVLACGFKSLPSTIFKVLNAIRVDDIRLQDCADFMVGPSVTSHLKATDARDKIYGVLSLYNNPPLQPDYSKTTNQVYTEFAKLSLKSQIDLLQWSGISNCENNIDWASWVPNWDHIIKSIPTTAVPWKEFSDTLGTRPVSVSIIHLKEVKFQDTPHLTALHIRGQLGSSITEFKSHDEWLELQNYKVAISSMYGKMYPNWTKHKSIPKLIALQRTLMQRDNLGRSTEEMELAAGFCSATMSRLNSASDTIDSMSEFSLSALLEMLENEFEDQPECFSLPKQYQNDYLLHEGNSLQRRVFLETSAGHFGLGPLGIQRGDIICKIYGFYFPLVLRKVNSHHVIIGTSWVLGYMGAQGLDESKSEMLEIW